MRHLAARRQAARHPTPTLALALALALAGVLAACTPGTPVARDARDARTAPASAPEDYAAELAELVGSERSVRGLPPLAPSACAQEQAAARAAALVEAGGLLTHAPLDGVTSACTATMAGENLSRADAPATEVVAAWMASPGHRSNIVAAYTATGVACAVAIGPSGDELVCSQVFLGP